VEAFSLTHVADFQARFEREYEPAFRANVRCFDDVALLLAWVSAARVPVGILTNSGDHYTQVKLELSGLAEAFTVVVTRDTLGFGKPDPRAFHRACRELGRAPGDTVYLGDHLSVDAADATEAGLYGVWLQRDPGDTEGAARARELGIPVVSSLSQLPALVAAHQGC
jgi:putative hydrolase of the HAD superfamily